jgi:hypothetical protein
VRDESECCGRLQVTCAACNWNAREGNDVRSALQVGVGATATSMCAIEARGARSTRRQRARCSVSLRMRSRRRSAARSGNGVQAHGGVLLLNRVGVQGRRVKPDTAPGTTWHALCHSQQRA